eukprot:GHVQ01014265.1.p1 GENE.GHVQ01014265.1~~GHVQ01014265.1.p1  ORF type:complete len:487 (-),score=132.19 GHVQ01014265.1:567-2027(-)
MIIIITSSSSSSLFTGRLMDRTSHAPQHTATITSAVSACNTSDTSARSNCAYAPVDPHIPTMTTTTAMSVTSLPSTTTPSNTPTTVSDAAPVLPSQQDLPSCAYLDNFALPALAIQPVSTSPCLSPHVIPVVSESTQSRYQQTCNASGSVARSTVAGGFVGTGMSQAESDVKLSGCSGEVGVMLQQTYWQQQQEARLACNQHAQMLPQGHSHLQYQQQQLQLQLQQQRLQQQQAQQHQHMSQSQQQLQQTIQHHQLHQQLQQLQQHQLHHHESQVYVDNSMLPSSTNKLCQYLSPHEPPAIHNHLPQSIALNQTIPSNSACTSLPPPPPPLPAPNFLPMFGNQSSSIPPVTHTVVAHKVPSSCALSNSRCSDTSTPGAAQLALQREQRESDFVGVDIGGCQHTAKKGGMAEDSEGRLKTLGSHVNELADRISANMLMIENRLNIFQQILHSSLGCEIPPPLRIPPLSHICLYPSTDSSIFPSSDGT